MIGRIPGFLGGKATSTYDKPENQTFATARDLNVFGEANVLAPHYKLVNDAGMPVNFKPYNSYYASNSKFYFLGVEFITGTSYTILYSANSLGTNSTYTEVYKVAGESVNFPLEEFNGSLWFGVVSSPSLVKYASLSGTPSASAASITDGVNLLRAHPGLGKLFYVHDSSRKIGWTDDSTYADSALVVGANDKIVSIDPYGQYLLVGVRDISRSKPSRILVWDGSATTVDDMMVLSTPNLQAFRVVGSNIRAVVADNSTLSIYEGPVGGNIEPVYTVDNVNSTGTTDINDETLAVNKGVLYFGFKSVGSLNPPGITLEQGVWAYGSDQVNKPKRLNLDRLIHTGVTSGVAINSIRFDGRFMVVLWNNGANPIAYFINHNNEGSKACSANGVYQTPRFRLHPYKRAKLKWLKIPHKPLPANTAFTVKVIHFGTEEKGNTPAAVETFAGATAYTSNVANSGYTLIMDGQLVFKYAEEIQIQIALTTVSGITGPEILFPITFETEEID